jgi:hypothetical protein
MDFIFMLTHNDLTVENCLDVFDEIADLGIAHVGFKDIGVGPEILDQLNRRIKAAGATSYLEVVSLSTADAERAARRARDIGVDCLLGGTDMAAMREAVSGTEIRCFPFVGRPEGHPTKLRGDGVRIAEDCRRSDALGCAGIDLLAYRAVDCDPLELVREARATLKGRLDRFAITHRRARRGRRRCLHPWFGRFRPRLSRRRAVGTRPDRRRPCRLPLSVAAFTQAKIA